MRHQLTHAYCKIRLVHYTTQEFFMAASLTSDLQALRNAHGLLNHPLGNEV